MRRLWKLNTYKKKKKFHVPISKDSFEDSSLLEDNELFFPTESGRLIWEWTTGQRRSMRVVKNVNLILQVCSEARVFNNFHKIPYKINRRVASVWRHFTTLINSTAISASPKLGIVENLSHPQSSRLFIFFFFKLHITNMSIIIVIYDIMIIIWIYNYICDL